MTSRNVRGRPGPALMILAAVAVVFFAIPIAGLLARTPWEELPRLLTEPVVIDALRISAFSSLTAMALATLLGVPLAWVLARSRLRGMGIVRAIVLLPLVLPPVVGGAALLFALGRRGVLGEPLYEATGLVLPFSFAGVVLAATFVAMPFLIITVEAALRATDVRLEDAAASLGASRRRILWRITLPSILPSLLSGMALTWARAFGEFGATVTFAGNLAGRTQTLPLAVFVALESDRDAAVAISLLMVVASLIVLLALRHRWWKL